MALLPSPAASRLIISKSSIHRAAGAKLIPTQLDFADSDSDRPTTPPTPKLPPRVQFDCPACSFTTKLLSKLIQHANQHSAGFYKDPIGDNDLAVHGYTKCGSCKCFFTKAGLGRHQRKCRGPVAPRKKQVAPPSDDPSQRSDIPLPSLEEVFTTAIPTLHFIPLAHRQAWGRVLGQELSSVAYHNDVQSWTRLLMLPKCILALPKRGGKRNRGDRHSISDLCEAWLRGELEWLWSRSQPSHTPRQRSNSDAKRAINIAIVHSRQGRYGKACASLSSSGLAPDNESTRSLLLAKHPSSPPPKLIDHDDFAEPLRLNDHFNLKGVLSSFSKDVGTDGTNFRIQHLLDADEAHLATPFLPRLRDVVNLLLSGNACPEVQPFLAGAKLTALSKSKDDIRPIAAGNVLRRVASKCACTLLLNRIRAVLGDFQVGVACKSGAEKMIHTMRSVLLDHSADPDLAVLKIDFHNAFNNVSRDVILEQCQECLPELVPWVQWCYGSPSLLFYSSSLTLKSSTGVQQGDPLGPLLFCLALRPLIDHIREAGGNHLHFHRWYLDDGVIVGSAKVVLKTFIVIQSHGPSLGLHLNVKKCELFSPNVDNFAIELQDPGNAVAVHTFPHELQRSTSLNFVLLGSPIGTDEFCSNYVSKLRVGNRRLLDRIVEIGDPQIGLHLLRTCASFCKYVYLCRTTPSRSIFDSLFECDKEIMDCLKRMAAVNLSMIDIELSSLSLSRGGLGLRFSSLHANAAFISSHAFALPGLMTSYVSDSFADFNVLLGQYGEDVISEEDMADLIDGKHTQRHLSCRLEDAHLTHLRSKLPTAQRIRMFSIQSSRSCAWLQATPSRGPVDMVLSPDEMQVALLHRLGCLTLTADDNYCSLCSEHVMLDSLGHHQVTCSTGGFVVRRHNMIRDGLYHLCRMAGLNPEKERGSFGGDQSRPADILIPNWSLGKAAALDITVVSPLISENIVGAGMLDVLEAAEESKHEKNDKKCDELGWVCIPLAVDSYGRWGEQAHKCFSDIANALSVRMKTSVGSALSSIYNVLGVILARQNARAILARRVNVGPVGGREIHRLGDGDNIDS